MNSSASPPVKDLFQTPEMSGAKSLTLRINGIVPSMKNNKMLIAKGPHGRPLERPLLITKPEYQKLIHKIIESLSLQLLSAFQTDSGETLTGCSLRSAIALSTPADDSWSHIPEIHLHAELCEPGQEGVEILIEQIG